jgi:hypothetical protein
VSRIMAPALVLALWALLSACGSASPPTPKDVRASIVAAALAQKSVHYEKNIEVDMEGTTTITADVTADSGIALEDSYDYGLVEIRLVNDTVYVKGDAAALRFYVADLPHAVANGYSGKWISIPKGDPLYAYVSDGLTLASIVHDVRSDLPVTHVNKLPARFAGEVDPSGEYTATSGTFSKWNEPVHVQAPANSTPIATLRAD